MQCTARSRFQVWLGWFEVFLPSDVRNPDHPGEVLCGWAKVRPRWYWLWTRIRLFLAIVWRKYEASRLSARTAWNVAGIVHGNGLTAKKLTCRN